MANTKKKVRKEQSVEVSTLVSNFHKSNRAQVEYAIARTRKKYGAYGIWIEEDAYNAKDEKVDYLFAVHTDGEKSDVLTELLNNLEKGITND